MRKRQVRCRRPISRPPAVPNRISFSTQAMPVRLRCRSFYIGLLCVPLCLIKFLFTPSLQLLAPFPLRNSKLFRFVVFFFSLLRAPKLCSFQDLAVLCLVMLHGIGARKVCLGWRQVKKRLHRSARVDPFSAAAVEWGKKGADFSQKHPRFCKISIFSFVFSEACCFFSRGRRNRSSKSPS